jgi:hypothetical protein
VQVEAGSTATSFDYRPYGTELQLCYRYYYITDTIGVSSQVNGQQFYAISANEAFSSGFAWPVTMRAAPTVTTYSLAGVSGGATILGGASLTGVTADYITAKTWGRLQKGAGWLTTNLLTANFTASAEL